MTAGKFGMIPSSVLKPGLVSRGAFRLYCFLRARFRSEKHPVYDASKLACSALGITDRTYWKLMRQLRDAGLVEVAPPPADATTQDGRRNTYRFRGRGKGEAFVKVPAFVLESGLSASAVRVYAVLASYPRDKNGKQMCPVEDEMCSRFGVSEKTFRRGLNELIAAGILIREQTYHRSSRTRRNTYRFPEAVSERSKRSTIERSKQSTNPESHEPEMTGRCDLKRPLGVTRNDRSYIGTRERLLENVKQETGVMPQAASEISDLKSKKEAGTTRRKSKRLTSLPSDFTVTEAMEQWAKENCPGVELTGATERFKKHYTAKGWESGDWTVVWRSWIQRTRPEPDQRPQDWWFDTEPITGHREAGW